MNMELLEKMYNGAGEGNISWFAERMTLLNHIIYKLKPITILEIGFNMGHSCKTILDTILSTKDEEYINKKKYVYIFDICSHDYTEPNFEIMKEHYKQYNFEMVLVKGSSLDTLENNVKDINNIDFANIDGLHTPEGVRSDFYILKDKISKNVVVYIDDYNSISCPEVELTKAIDELDWSEFDTSSIRGVMYGTKK